jgi:hypothetical protein
MEKAMERSAWTQEFFAAIDDKPRRILQWFQNHGSPRDHVSTYIKWGPSGYYARQGFHRWIEIGEETMSDRIPERDWKYMRRIQPDLLDALSGRINQRSLAILSDEAKSAHESYQRLYGHVLESDEVVADCFDDWRRSNLVIKLIFLRRHGLLKNEHLENLSESTRGTLKALEGGRR